MESKNGKHYGGFWPLFLVFVVALVLGGIITIFAYNSGLQDEIDSISIKIHKPASNDKGLLK